ncbi:MAG: single-stranded DNA-binding protein [Bryobacteraceae bacterium]
MPYYAHATVMGHLGRDVETKHLSSGKAVHEFFVAVSDKRGAEKVTSWYAVKVWGDMPEWKTSELRKGALVMVAGRLSVETWESGGKSGSKTVITADPFNGVNVFGKAEDQGGGMVSRPRGAAQPVAAGISDDDVPF